MLIERKNIASYVDITLIVFVSLIIILSLWLPYGWDHGIMAQVGHTVLEGGLPYRDAWDLKGPLAFLIFAISELLFGRNMWGIRLIDALILVPAAVVLGKAVSELSAPRYGIWASLGFLLSMSSSGWFFSAQPDGWVAAITILGIAPFFKQGPNAGASSSAISGFLFGLAGLVKPLYLLYGIVPAAAIAVSDRPLPERIQNWGALALGAIVPVALVLGTFAAEQAFAQLMEVHVLWPLTSYSGLAKLSAETTLKALSRQISQQPVSAGLTLAAFALMLPFAGLGLLSLKTNRQLFIVLSSWTVISAVIIVLQGKFFPYHFYPLYPALLCLALIGLYKVTRAKANPLAVRSVFIIGIIGFFLPISVNPLKQALLTAEYLFGSSTKQQYYSNFQVRLSSVFDQIHAADYLLSHSSAADELFVLGHESMVTYLTGLKAPTRFVYSLPLYRTGPYLHTYRLEALSALCARWPKYILVGTPYGNSQSKTEFLTAFPQLNLFVKNYYKYDKSFGYLDLYLRQTHSVMSRC